MHFYSFEKEQIPIEGVFETHLKFFIFHRDLLVTIINLYYAKIKYKEE